MAVALPGKFIYLAHPHTGSSATALGLQGAFRESLNLPHHMSLADVLGEPGAVHIEQMRHQATRIWEHSPQKQRGPRPDGRSPREFTGGEHVFTTIRNPYDFLVSCFAHSGRGRSFDQFVRSYHEDPYVRDGRLWYHETDCHEILRYEILQEELDATMARLSLPAIPLPRRPTLHGWGLGAHDVTEDMRTWESYYTPTAFQIVNERFGDELSRHYPLRE